ncbi:5'-3' exonuclease H3TH domain-containing protein [Planomonospora sp. ID82291]|uniref:5'-3' exonuclease n=1 Tax=Planomonospora sp. ID82291 TaxID=2738136 RepID=UPI0018C39385|nr:5'-3' exonuclease H3TH domain-containing protein [Planomonospora sp. ID82291]MBG0818410.1 flap endonuclease [Planomonospora sp. ID82291]
MSDVPLLLVDGHGLLWRAEFGFPTRVLSRDRSRDITGGFGFMALLRVAIRSELPAPPEVIVVFDGEHGVAGRRALDPAYKAHRPADEAALAPIRTLPDVKRALEVVGVPWVEFDDAEADDVIATLAAAAGPDRDVWVMASDRDFYQLVTDRIRVLNTAMHPGCRVIGPKEIEARYGVAPRRWCDRVALVGDPSDGIAGVRGIGTKTAARLLEGGLGIEDLPDSDRLTGRAGRLVREHFAQVLTWRDMVRLRTDLVVSLLPCGHPASDLPKPAEVMTALDLW